MKLYPSPEEPLHAIARVTQFLIALIALPLLVFLPLSALQDGWSFGAYGNTEACVTAPASAFPVTDSPVTPRSIYGNVMGLRPGSTTRLDSLEVCLQDPTARDRLTATTAQTLPTLFFLAVLVALQWTVGAAWKSGLFSPTVAIRIRLTGWFLIWGSLIAEVIRQIAIGTTLSGAVDDKKWDSTLSRLDFPYSAVLVGIGLLSLARVLARAVILQRHEDATI